MRKVAILILFVFLATVSFSVVAHHSSGEGECIFGGLSDCPISLSGVLHHIAAYTSFSNVPIPQANSLNIFGIVLFAGSTYVLGLAPPRWTTPINVGDYRSTAPKLLRWLSLFETSPTSIQAA